MPVCVVLCFPRGLPRTRYCDWSRCGAVLGGGDIASVYGLRRFTSVLRREPSLLGFCLSACVSCPQVHPRFFDLSRVCRVFLCPCYFDAGLI